LSKHDASLPPASDTEPRPWRNVPELAQAVIESNTAKVDVVKIIRNAASHFVIRMASLHILGIFGVPCV
jgi:hypothetical protein